eukprot:3634549-Lingulodinium_polyedra.AAC.1
MDGVAIAISRLMPAGLGRGWALLNRSDGRRDHDEATRQTAERVAVNGPRNRATASGRPGWRNARLPPGPQ